MIWNGLKYSGDNFKNHWTATIFWWCGCNLSYTQSVKWCSAQCVSTNLFIRSSACGKFHFRNSIISSLARNSISTTWTIVVPGTYDKRVGGFWPYMVLYGEMPREEWYYTNIQLKEATWPTPCVDDLWKTLSASLTCDWPPQFYH